MGRRLRTLAGLWVLAEVVVYVLVAAQIGVGWTILASLATTALGFSLLARQGTKALEELRERARTRSAGGRALGDAGLGAAGAALMVLPGFLGDLVGLMCLLPGVRALPRAVAGRVVLSRLPDRLRGPVRVRSSRSGQVGSPGPAAGATAVRVIEGEVLGRPAPDR